MGLFGDSEPERSKVLVAEMLKAESVSLGGRKFDGKQVRIVKGLQTENELLAHDLKIARMTEAALRQQIAILQEAQLVLRDALAAHQVTSQLHAAEGKLLIREVEGS